jgi:hypothetical protein
VCEANPGLHVHSYDRFFASGKEPAKAGAFGVTLAARQNTLPTFKANTKGLRVTAYRGRIEQAAWCGEPIAMHIDDACKRREAFDASMATFAPSWVAGLTLVVLLDYHYWKRFLGYQRKALQYQKTWVEARSKCFEKVSHQPAVFRYLGGLPL